MPDIKWRYTFHDPLTGEYIDDLPLEGVGYDYGIPTNIGQFQGTLYLGDSSINKKSWQAAIQPYRIIHVWANGILQPPVYMLYDADRSRGDRSVTLSAQELWSYWHRRTVDIDYTFTQTEQLNIFRQMINDAQSLSKVPPGYSVPPVNANLLCQFTQGNLVNSGMNSTFVPLASGVLRDRSYVANDAKDLALMLEELSAVIDGFDFVLESYLVSAGTPGRRFRFGYPRLGMDQSNSNLQFQYIERGGGPIVDWDWPTTGSAVYTDRIALGDNGLRQDALDYAAMGNGVPLMQKPITYSTVTDPNVLIDHANADLATSNDPQGLPKITVRLNEDPPLGSYNLGDDALIHLEDYAQFPGPWDSWDGNDYRVNAWFRIVNIKVRPPDDQADLTLNSANVTAYRESAANQAVG